MESEKKSKKGNVEIERLDYCYCKCNNLIIRIDLNTLRRKDGKTDRGGQQRQFDTFSKTAFKRIICKKEVGAIVCHSTKKLFKPLVFKIAFLSCPSHLQCYYI